LGWAFYDNLHRRIVFGYVFSYQGVIPAPFFKR
jgi:hypothetical protein